MNPTKPPVFCPWHGSWDGHPGGVEMELKKTEAPFTRKPMYWYGCPLCTETTPGARTENDAYIMATHRFTQPNLPLTLDELTELPQPWPLWIEYRGGLLLPCIMTDKAPQYNDEPAVYFIDERTDRAGGTWNYITFYGRFWRVWQRKPTPDEQKLTPFEEAG